MRWVLYALAALVLAGIVGLALFPLSLALKLADAPLTGTPTGTVWNGKVTDAAANGVPLGEVRIGAHPWPTLIGEPAGSVAVAGPRGTGTANVRAAGQAVALTSIDAVIPADPYGLTGPFGASVTGTVAVQGSATLSPTGKCREADLVIETNVLQDAGARIGQPGPVLTGPATCEDGTLVARLTGRADSADAAAFVRLRPGAYVTELTLTPADPRAGAVLPRYGFRRTPEGYTLTTRGTY